MVKELCLDYFRCLRNIFRIKWRMSKRDFCRFMTVHFVVCLPWLIAAYFIQNFWFVLLLLIIPYLAMMHRLQDMGKSGFRLLLYMFASIVGFFVCFICASHYVDSIVQVPSVHPGWTPEYEQKRLVHSLYTMMFRWVLFFGVFVFLSREWFLRNGEEIANKFGEPHEDEQNKVNKWFLVLAALLITFVLYFPWGVFWGDYATGTIG